MIHLLWCQEHKKTELSVLFTKCLIFLYLLINIINKLIRKIILYNFYIFWYSFKLKSMIYVYIFFFITLSIGVESKNRKKKNLSTVSFFLKILRGTIHHVQSVNTVKLMVQRGSIMVSASQLTVTRGLLAWRWRRGCFSVKHYRR